MGRPLNSNMITLTNPNASVLTIWNVQQEDGGVYTCSGIIDGYLKFNNMALLVLAGTFYLYNTEIIFSFSCHAKYTGI